MSVIESLLYFAKHRNLARNDDLEKVIIDIEFIKNIKKSINKGP